MQKSFVYFIIGLVVLIILIVILRKEEAGPVSSFFVSSKAEPEVVPTPKRNDYLAVKVNLSATDQNKLAIINDILNRHDDNDPRMDTELKDLSAELIKQLRALYQASPMEKRNDRGTLVFLLGRNLRSEEDLNFIDEVLSEPACLSLENCAAATRDEGGSGHEEIPGLDISLHYPQVVALISLEKLLSNPDLEKSNPALFTLARQIVERAMSSQTETVSSRAERIKRELRF